MGESKKVMIPTFNRSINIEGRPERLTGDAGVILLRETVDRLAIIDYLDDRLEDPRNPLLITHPFRELLRTEICRLAQGWRDQDDADYLRHDGAF